MEAVKRNEFNRDRIRALAKELNCTEVYAEILLSRGIDNKFDYNSFISPDLSALTDPFLYADMRAAVERINIAIENKETIVIYGDYDCDGICSVSILWMYLLEKGANVEYFIPNRHVDGYGISLSAVEKIAEEKFPDLIITVDCGITAVEEIKVIREEYGIDVIVTDHHECPEILPDCITVNPKRKENSTLFREYCGAGVVFTLIRAISGDKNAFKYLDIVAVATIGDVVSLTGDNRIITYWGLKLINSSRCVRGIKQMLASLNYSEYIDETIIAFRIVPRINSFGRLGDAARAVVLFTSNDYFVLECLIKEFDSENSKRQEMCADIEKSAIEALEKEKVCESHIIISCNPVWDSGVIGIVAARLAEKYHKPAILFTEEDGVFKGSARSVDGVDIYALLLRFSDLFLKFGGHSQAAGLSIAKKNFELFENRINDYLNKTPELITGSEIIKYDCDIEESEITDDFVEKIELLAPFGCGNLIPLFKINCREMNFAPISRKASEHIKAVRNGYSIVAYNSMDRIGYLNSKNNKQLFVSLSYNVFNGKKYVQANLSDVIGEIGEDAEYELTRLLFDLQLEELKKDKYRNLLLDMSTDRSVFVNYYKYLQELLLQKDNINNYFAISITKNSELYNTLQLRFCCAVFKELGIIYENCGSLRIRSDIKVNLRSSKLFALIAEIKE